MNGNMKEVALDTNIAIKFLNGNLEIRKELKDIGNPIPENDIWISALCIVNDISLISSDKHFDKVTRLKLINLE